MSISKGGARVFTALEVVDGRSEVWLQTGDFARVGHVEEPKSRQCQCKYSASSGLASIRNRSVEAISIPATENALFCSDTRRIHYSMAFSDTTMSTCFTKACR
jgi:hypothetical protein